VKGRPRGDVPHLLPHQRREDFSSTSLTYAFVPEEGPDQPEGRDDLTGIDSFSRAVCGTFLFRLELHRPAFSVDQDFPDRLAAQQPDGQFPVAADQPGELIQQRQLCFFACLLIPGFVFPVVFLSWLTPTRNKRPVGRLNKNGGKAWRGRRLV
jgi:hypothetical protein